MVLLIEVYYNRYRHVTFTGRLNTYGTIHRHNLHFTIHLQADYNIDTLQNTLILTALYTGTTYIYNADAVHLQGALIDTLLLHFIHAHI